MVRRHAWIAGLGLVAGLTVSAPQELSAQYIWDQAQVVPVDPGRPWGWAVRDYMEKPDRPLYNTAKAKLLRGEQVFSHTISTFDIERYCEEAPHYDFTWFEMQHSTLRWDEIEAMIAACPRVGATPMVRMPDTSESSVQKAMDIGALGVIFPTIDNYIEAHEAAAYVRFPPLGKRSSGAGQASRIWSPAVEEGETFRSSINDNMLVVVMIETVEGVQNALEIAATPGVDVVILGNSDLSSFSGFSPNDPRYQDLLVRVRNAAYRAGKFWGNANAGLASGNPLSADSRFHQNGPSNDGWSRAGRGGGPGGAGGGPAGRGGGAGPGGGE